MVDTNVWLDLLVFHDPAVEPLREAIRAGRAEVFIDAACEAELERVLAYPLGKTSLNPEERAQCMAQFRRIAKYASPLGAEQTMRLPRCSDRDDQKFLEVALAARADFLITKDRALLDLDRRLRKRSGSDPEWLDPALFFRIVKPEAFHSTLR